MKNLSKVEIEQTEKGIVIDLMKQAVKKAPFSTTKKSLKVFPFFEEKTFKNKNKVFPALYINNQDKYICMIVRNKIVSISSLEHASEKFVNFTKNH